MVNTVLRARGRAGNSTGEVTIGAGVLDLNRTEPHDRTLQLERHARDRQVGTGHVVARTCGALRTNVERQVDRG